MNALITNGKHWINKTQARAALGLEHTSPDSNLTVGENILQNKQINFEDKIQRTKIDFCCFISSKKEEKNPIWWRRDCCMAFNSQNYFFFIPLH